MAKHKKKPQRGPRNPSITVVFATDTRKAIEVKAIEDDLPKSMVIARLVESALGVVRTVTAPAAPIAPRKVEAITLTLPDGSRVYGFPKTWTPKQKQAFMDQQEENSEDTPEGTEPQESQTETFSVSPTPASPADVSAAPELNASVAGKSETEAFEPESGPASGPAKGLIGS